MSLVHLPPRGVDEPAVLNPALADLVEIARRRTAPQLSIDAEAVRKAWLARRQRRRQRLGLAAAAVLIGVFAASLLPKLDRGRDDAQVAAAPSTATTTEQAGAFEPPPAGVRPGEIEQPTGPDRELDDATVPVQGVAPVLAEGVRFVAEPPEGARYEVLGAWEVRVAAGRYEVAVPIELHHSLRIELASSARVPGRVLEVDAGGSVVLDAGAEPPARLLAGSAAWLDADGNRTPLVRVDKPDVDAPGLLARKAEKQMADGDRSGAIKSLRALVRRYPAAASTRAAVLDLGRLLRAAGRTDEARCAYRMHLERWPSVMRSEIEAVLRELGDGPACRGLAPK